MSEPTGAGDYVALVEGYIDRGMTDGLPVVPPTREAVAAAVDATGRDGDEELGLVPPVFATARVRDIAVNAVMAGCRPDDVPVVLAAVEVMLAPSFNLLHLATSTKGCAPLVIVNGPVRRRIGMNATGDVFGPGHRANATIGRALRLVMINLGGAVSQELDRAVMGHPGKFTYAIAEDEEGSPWEPLHVQAGYDPGDSVVTVVPCEAPRTVNNALAGSPEAVLDTVGDSASTLGSFGFSGPAECVVVLSPEHRAPVAAAGWSKRDVQQHLFRRCWRPAGELQAVDNAFPGVAGAGPDDPIAQFREPSDIHVVAAGGPGPVSAVCYGFTCVDEERSGSARVGGV